MSTQNLYKIIGIMTGTSMDGFDCSYINTDGKNRVKIISEKSYNNSNDYISKLRKHITNTKFNNSKKLKDCDNLITKRYIFIIKKFIKEFKINSSKIDFIGISGQTIFHDPKKKSIQLGSCQKIKKKINIKIIGNFRDNDIKNGGQGAPIGAFYHHYILKNFTHSAALINLGGISNISYINKKLFAFDLGPANLLIDDIMNHFFNKNYDKYGKNAFKGNSNNKIINLFKKDKYFKLKFPKSLDRNYFKKYYKLLIKLDKYDAVNTASIMTIEAILMGLKLINKKIKILILTGGGRKNTFLIKKLNERIKFNKKIYLIDNYNFNGDLLEAQAFAYISARSVKNLPLSIPTTTGVKKPTLGGIIYQ